MEKIKLKKSDGKITISKINTPEGYIMEVSLMDNNSRIEFARAKLSMEQFAEAITGLGHVPCEIKYRDLENVGKKKEKKPLIFPIPEDNRYSPQIWAENHAQKFADEGWTADIYFNSQNSFFSMPASPDDFNHGTIKMARTIQFRYVDE